MQIIRSKAENIDVFQSLWSAALAYQKEKDYPLWPNFPSDLIKGEITEHLHYSAFSAQNELLGYFSLALSDPFIWEDEDKEDAIYIHRMCVNPHTKSSKLANSVLIWAYGYAQEANRSFIRMDTWANNQNLVEYYIKCGFKHIRTKQLGEMPMLPKHYSNCKLAMFQNEILHS